MWWIKLKMYVDRVQKRTRGVRVACAILGAGILGYRC